MKLDNTVNVVAHLRELHKKAFADARNRGAEYGRMWAEDTATPSELRRLENLTNDCDLEQFFDCGCDLVFNQADRLFAVIKNADHLSRRESSDFWASVVGRDAICCEDGFAMGFIEGAVGSGKVCDIKSDAIENPIPVAFQSC